MQNWRKEIPAYLVIKEKCSLWNIRLKMLSSAMLYTQCVNNNGKSKIESKVRIFCHFFHHKQKCRCNHLIYNGILFNSVGVRRLYIFHITLIFNTHIWLIKLANYNKLAYVCVYNSHNMGCCSISMFFT